MQTSALASGMPVERRPIAEHPLDVVEPGFCSRAISSIRGETSTAVTLRDPGGDRAGHPARRRSRSRPRGPTGRARVELRRAARRDRARRRPRSGPGRGPSSRAVRDEEPGVLARAAVPEPLTPETPLPDPAPRPRSRRAPRRRARTARGSACRCSRCRRSEASTNIAASGTTMPSRRRAIHSPTRPSGSRIHQITSPIQVSVRERPWNFTSFSASSGSRTSQKRDRPFQKTAFGTELGWSSTYSSARSRSSARSSSSGRGCAGSNSVASRVVYGRQIHGMLVVVRGVVVEDAVDAGVLHRERQEGVELGVVADRPRRDHEHAHAERDRRAREPWPQAPPDQDRRRRPRRGWSAPTA